jgi:septum site-determining protein MinC
LHLLPMNRTTTSPFDIKSATIQGLSLILRSIKLDVIEGDLAARVANAGDLFTNAPVLINVSALTAEGTADKLELTRLVNLLRRHTMRAVGIVGATGLLLKQAQALGLVEEPDVQPRVRNKAPQAAPEPEPAPVAEAAPQAPGTTPPVVTDLFADAPASASPSTPTPAEAAVPQAQAQEPPRDAATGRPAPTMVIDRPLRSGQRVYARGGDLVVLGVVSHGAEVIADGNIHVYGPLRGRAIAGATGDVEARIFAVAMEPELISIAGTYRTTDKPLADTVRGKPAQARLDGDKMLIEPLKN